MSDPITFRITLEMVEAIRRDGTVGTDLTVAEWMQRSRPHGEYCSATLRMMTMASLIVMSVVVWKSPDGLAGGALGGHAGAVMVILS